MMSSVQLALNIASIFLFAIASCQYTRVFIDLRKCNIPKEVMKLAKIICLFGLALSVLFVVLQTDWIIKNHSDSVGSATSWSWLVYNYLMGVYLVTVGTITHVFSRWKGKELQQIRLKRRWYD